jgi:CRISPR type III-A-associated protein Csm2
VVDGDARELVESARRFANQLEDAGVTQTSLRRLFGEVRRIEMLWQQNAEAARRRATLLIPRMAYAASREKSLQPVQERFEPMLDLAVEDEEQAEVRFRRCVEYFEALVAYLKPKDSPNAR